MKADMRPGPTLPSAKDTVFAREYWTGDSRDGGLVNGEGYHFYKMKNLGLITEAYEVYETEDGTEIVSPLPEMLNVHWVNDLGFKEWEALEIVSEEEFDRVKHLALKN